MNCSCGQCPSCYSQFYHKPDVSEAMERLLVIRNRVRGEKIKVILDSGHDNPAWDARQRILQIFTKGHSQKAMGI